MGHREGLARGTLDILNVFEREVMMWGWYTGHTICSLIDGSQRRFGTWYTGYTKCF